MEHENRLNQLIEIKETLQFINNAQIRSTFGDCDTQFTFDNELDIEDVHKTVRTYIENQAQVNAPTHDMIVHAVAYVLNVVDIIEAKYNCNVYYTYPPTDKINDAISLLNKYLDDTTTAGEQQELDVEINEHVFAQLPKK